MWHKLALRRRRFRRSTHIESGAMQRRPRLHPIAEPSQEVDRIVFELGDAEWAALPDLDIPAVHAKIDTGARTSALHARDIQVHQTSAGPKVCFNVHPVVGDLSVVRRCETTLLGQRWVTSSNGGRELRCVIATTIEIGGRRWPIEVTLTDRSRMRYRMLLGRRALLDDMIVVSSRVGRHPVIGYDVYHESGHRRQVRPAADTLRIGLVGDGPVGPRWQSIADAATERGHLVERIDVRRCRLSRGDGDVRLELGGRALPPLDAVITLDASANSSFLSAVLHQAERAGAVCLNSAAALMRAQEPTHAMQTLWGADLPTVPIHLGPNGADVSTDAGTWPGTDVSGLVVAGRIVACHSADRPPQRRWRRDVAVERKLSPAQRRLMIRAAAALDLGLARIDLCTYASGEIAVSAIDAAPDLDARLWPGRRDVARRVVKALEKRMRI